MNKNTDRYRTDWNGHLLEIPYEPRWMPAHVTGEDLAPLQVRSIDPTDAPLPIAQTGLTPTPCRHLPYAPPAAPLRSST